MKYNICFIQRNEQILLLNRDKPSWMGAWNGVGGKLEPNETPLASVKREVLEETGLVPNNFTFKGFVTWQSDQNKKSLGGMYLYLAKLDSDSIYETPVKTTEGILDWKDVNWILHPMNVGVASHLPKYLPLLLHDEGCFNHHSIFSNGVLVDLISKPISRDYENVQDHLLDKLIDSGIIDPIR